MHVDRVRTYLRFTASSFLGGDTRNTKSILALSLMSKSFLNCLFNEIAFVLSLEVRRSSQLAVTEIDFLPPTALTEVFQELLTGVDFDTTESLRRTLCFEGHQSGHIIPSDMGRCVDGIVRFVWRATKHFFESDTNARCCTHMTLPNSNLTGHIVVRYNKLRL